MAFRVDVPDNVIDASIDCCNAGNMGNRGDGSDGTKVQQMTGIIGQNMLHQALGKPLMKAGGGFDGGIDGELSGLTFDIKTMGRDVDPSLEFVNNLMQSQTKFKVDFYIFASLNRQTNKFTVCGWIPKHLFLKRATLFEKGAERKRRDGTTFQTKAAMYEIKNSDLNYKAKNWADLFDQIKIFSKHPMFQTHKEWLQDYDKGSQ